MTDDLAAQVVLLHLGRGRDAALSIGELSEMLNWPRRKVEKAAQQLADDGRHPLVACERGIYLGTVEEVEAYTDALRRRLVSQYRRIRALRGLARRMRGYRQLSLDLVA